MKKKTIAWAAAALIVALVSAAFLRPIPSEFGYGSKLYTPIREELELLSGGEHFIVEKRGVTMHNGVALELRIIRKNPDQLYTRGTMRIAENKKLDKRSTSGIIERFDGGEWVNIGGAGGNFMYTMQGRTDAASVHDFYLLHDSAYYCDEGGSAYPLSFRVLGSPGRYRVTLYFRECFNYGTEYTHSFRDGPIYTTGDDLIELTFELEVAGTDSAIDVAGVELSSYELGGSAGSFLRSNYASPAEPYEYIQENGAPYLDTSSLMLEKRVGFTYQPVETGEAAGLELQALGHHFSPKKLPEYFRDEPDWYNSTPDFRTDRLGYYEFTLSGENFDPTAEYRVTMQFVENEDGSGERHTLKLRLKFTE